MLRKSEILDAQTPDEANSTRNRVENSPETLEKNDTRNRVEEIRISPRTGKPIQKKYSHVDHTKKAIKKKPRGGNSPVIGMNGYNLKEGDNNKITRLSLEIFNMPAIDLENPEEVAQRLNDYFAVYAKADMKPTVAGMAMALNGMSRTTLLAIVNDYGTGSDGYKSALPRAVTEIIKKAYKIMETSWESYLTAGKLNPVTGIFLAKNNFGYKDQNEYVLTPNRNDDSEVDAEAIKARYLPKNKDK